MGICNTAVSKIVQGISIYDDVYTQNSTEFEVDPSWTININLNNGFFAFLEFIKALYLVLKRPVFLIREREHEKESAEERWRERKKNTSGVVGNKAWPIHYW